MNLQAVEPVVSSRKDGKLEVVKIYRTIQGEGPFVGRPAVFVRLAGCNLQCPKCDTDYTSQRDEFTPMDILYRASILIYGQQHQKFIVLTGGEPFRQDIVPFLHHALDHKWQVQIETNGAFIPKRFTESFLRRENPPMELQQIFDLRDPPDISIVCSPKTTIHPDIVPLVDAWKYVVRAGDINPDDGLPLHALDNKVPVARPPIIDPLITYIQPCDEGDETLNRANMAAALDSCMRFGYRLCIQTHKIVGLE